MSENRWLISTSSDWKTPTLKVIKTDINGQITTNYQARSSLIIKFFQ